jgi:DNA mismatch endonuclease (patch repair protein)
MKGNNMADVHNKQTRSFNMSRIKSRNTRPELLVRKFLFSKGFRFRLHSLNLPGKPDIVLPKYNTVIFINGCFWHGHKGCPYFILPKTNTEWWLHKITNTCLRDSEAENKLNVLGWRVIEVWTCELKKDKRDQRLSKLIREISYI